MPWMIRQWWMQTVDFAVAYEARGNPPLAGSPDWNEYWVWMIEVNKKSRENPQRYIDYIVNQRAKAGLSPLRY